MNSIAFFKILNKLFLHIKILKLKKFITRKVLLTFILFSVYTTFGQNSVNNKDGSNIPDKNPIGIGVGFVYPDFSNIESDAIFPLPGLEIEGFYRRNNIFKTIQAHLGAQYRLLNYESDSLGGIVRSDNAVFNIGILVPLFGIPEFKFVTALTPNYNIDTRFISRSQVDSINPSRSLNNEMLTRFNLGVKFGLELQLKEAIHLQLYYNGISGLEQKNKIVQSAPSNFGVKVLFELNKIELKEPVKFRMADTFNVLKNDTLYIIDRTCDNITRDKLFALFSEYYNFSQFRILSNDEIGPISKQSNTTFFALVGEYVASEFDPENVGIFLFDKDLNYLSRPFPHFTQYLAWDKCMTDENALIRLIGSFNNRLIKASNSNK